MVETIEFDIQLDVQGDPALDIYVDNILYTHHKFTATLEFGNHELRIVHSGKTNQTPEQMVDIKSITVDGVNIQDILYTDSINIPEYPEPWATQQRAEGVVLEETVIGQLELSHNCVWRLNFTSPFYEFVMNHVR